MMTPPRKHMIFNETLRPIAALHQAEHYFPSIEGRASSSTATTMEDVGIFLSFRLTNQGFMLSS
jgi:hypothetical protein